MMTVARPRKSKSKHKKQPNQTNILVGLSAVLPDLAVGAGEGAEIGHLYHGGGEVVEKRSRVGAVGIDLSVGGTVVKELLIGMQQSLQTDQILEVVVVECGRADHIQRRQVVVTAATWALALRGGGKCGVYVGLVVDSVPESGAPCLSYCVGPCVY